MPCGFHIMPSPPAHSRCVTGRQCARPGLVVDHRISGPFGVQLPVLVDHVRVSGAAGHRVGWPPPRLAGHGGPPAAVLTGGGAGAGVMVNSSTGRICVTERTARFDRFLSREAGTWFSAIGCSGGWYHTADLSHISVALRDGTSQTFQRSLHAPFATPTE